VLRVSGSLAQPPSNRLVRHDLGLQRPPFPLPLPAQIRISRYELLPGYKAHTVEVFRAEELRLVIWKRVTGQKQRQSKSTS
jgi:hypothetical protein